MAAKRPVFEDVTQKANAGPTPDDKPEPVGLIDRGRQGARGPVRVWLAILFLFFVHWYNVHYSPEKFPSASVWVTGYLSEEEMIHEHYDEYVRIMTEHGLQDEIKPQAFAGQEIA